MYTLIFVSLIVSAWLVLGFIPWLVASVVTRGHAGLGTLPLCLVAAVVGGLAVPLLGRDDGWGMLLSAIAAVVASAVLITIRRFAVSPATALQGEGSGSGDETRENGPA